MAFLQSIILGSTSFLLGLVFVCQIIDIPLLYHTHLTEASLESAYAFYTMWYDAPKAVKALLHTALGIPLLAIVSKLHGWSESAVFFDGSCLVLHMASIVIYLTIHVPNLPVFVKSSNLSPDMPTYTEEEKQEAVRVLSAGNALVGFCLLGIILMQAGQEYAKRQEEAEMRKLDARTARAGATAEGVVVGGDVQGKKDL
ncbi:hypothetical protein FFLO_04275 [Filobasidium floriforme]|uniref:Shr3 amino acid permease chaperone n=1 Tax=Filobasidium floriforme TaxID=5210 RepID=A0A8K0NQ22_9TREE|nr:Shr3 amino acid permease chaperone [Filobasidium floriforme]KAG7531535.1 hypothetical protein FFLO_04275 [Filobasidium floriforme]KAH8089713.1 Shr3 amino acid permease chaperone [Filobasidium floriforme]